MEIDIVGEDPVTQAIIERLVKEYRKDIKIKNRLPARGGQLKNLAPKYNLLQSPIFLLTDLDTYACPPSLIKDWFGEQIVQNNMLFRVANEEAETWLMADRKGFSKWLNVEIDLIPIPKIIDKNKNIAEIIFPLKPSLHMMMKIASQSKNEKLKESLTPKKGASKGPGYNMAILPFIEKNWNIENAATNSYSLSVTIERLKKFKKL